MTDEDRGFVFHTPNGDVEMEIDEVRDLAKQGDVDGCYAYGMALLFGWDTEPDPETGYAYLQKAAESGQTEAMTLLVRLYMQGEYEMDTAKAVKYSMTAADDGIPDAQLYAGLACMDGVGVKQDYTEAARYFRLAANQGNSEARASLAYLFQEGLGVERDEAKAFKLYRTSAKAGNVNSMFQLGICYEFGVGTPVDTAKAAEWYSKGSEQGDAFATERLAFLHADGFGSNPPDLEQAFELFLKSAMNGVSTAMFTVGSCYLHGTGVEKDEKEAVKWLRMAADNGIEDARVILDSLPPSE